MEPADPARAGGRFRAVRGAGWDARLRRYSVHLERLRIENAPFAVALLLTLGLAAIIGAFLAGMVLAEAREHYPFAHQAQPPYQFLVPFFFVIHRCGGEPGRLH
jgi:hypothetical protein